MLTLFLSQPYYCPDWKPQNHTQKATTARADSNPVTCNYALIQKKYKFAVAQIPYICHDYLMYMKRKFLTPRNVSLLIFPSLALPSISITVMLWLANAIAGRWLTALPFIRKKGREGGSSI